MLKYRNRNITLWIRYRTLKRGLFSLCLMVFLVGLTVSDIRASTTWSYWSLPLAGKVIVLDAGHGGPDGGAVSKEGIIEKDINLAITLYLRDYLQQAGAVVKLIREDDRDLADESTRGYARRKTEDLKRRVRLVEEYNTDLFLSIHMNSVPSSRWSGAQTFYYPSHAGNASLAALIQDEIRHNMENTNRTSKTVDTVYLLQALKMPSALVEIGFLSHPGEARLLANEAYQRQISSAVYKGILRYFSGERVTTPTGK